MDITVLSQTKKRNLGNELKQNFLLFYSGIDKFKRTEADVVIAVHNKWKRKGLDTH